jgi:endonuclease/exonuclease/phosphatase family metal-dependent hydrolase
MKMDVLRVATINIWNKSGPWPLRLPLIKAEIGRLSPDLVGLQEVLRLAPDAGRAGPTPDTCQAVEIAAGGGWHIAFAEAAHYGSGLSFGNALLSRWPIVEEEALRLPGEESGETRALLYARVDAPWGRIPVFVTHLNWKLHHGSVRLRQVRFIVDRIMERAPIDDDAPPPILMGDMNAEPDADEMRYLRGLATLEGRSVYFADAWVYGGYGSAGATFDRQNRFAALAHEPPRRIDYIYVRGPDRKLRGEPLVTRLAFATPEAGADGPIWPSDHFGLYTELCVSPREVK